MKGNTRLLGHKHSADSRQKMSEARKGNKYALGHKHSADSRQKMSEAQKGRKHTPETRQKISQANKGQTPWTKGRKLTPEHRRKIGQGHKGKKLTAEHREFLSKSQKQNYAKKQEPARQYYLSLPADMPLSEKRKHLREKFPDKDRSTIYRWVKMWSKQSE